MAKQVTMSDIAKEVNVSIVTVSKALANKDGVSESLREQIKQVADELGYIGSHNAKNEKEPYTIGVLTAKRYMDTPDSFYWMMYQEIVSALGKEGAYAFIEVVDREEEKSCKMPQMIRDSRVDALILLGQMKEYYIEKIEDQNLPLLFLDFHSKEIERDAIVGDNLYGAYQITNYLIEQGHTQIGYIGDIYATTSILDRYLGYVKAIVENNLILKQEWLLNDQDEDGTQEEVGLPESLPTAFVCHCDKAAYYLIQRLSKMGLNVPNDISVVGFDDSIYSTLSQPGITTIKVDCESMAREAARGIIEKIENQFCQLGRKVLAGQLKVRESVKKIR